MVRALKLKRDPAELIDQLENLPEALHKAAVENLNAIGAIGVSVARSLHAPHVDTGTLDSSIRYEVVEEGPRLTLRLLAGGNEYINPKTGKPCNYAGIIEAKWPFLRPAIEYIRPMVQQVVDTITEAAE